MTDFFAVLDEPRRPWLDTGALKQKFLARSAELHPDRVHSAGEAQKAAAHERYAELNAAYQCLSEPKERLRHLLELERGGKLQQVQSIPRGLMELSLEVGRVCREADGFLAEKGRATSPLLQVELFAPGQGHVEKITALLKQIDALTQGLKEQLVALDADWQAGPMTESASREAQLQQAEEIYRLLSYCAKWSGHLRERVVQLSF